MPMKNLPLIVLFAFIFSFQQINAQSLDNINSNALKITNKINDGISLNELSYSIIHLAYVEYQSKLISMSSNKEKKTKTFFGQRERALQIGLQNTIKEQLDPKKFEEYIKFTNQMGLTKRAQGQNTFSIVYVSGDTQNNITIPKPSSRTSLSENN